MNPDLSTPTPEELEARITAFLLDELSADEAAEVSDLIRSNAEAARLHERLSRTVSLLKSALGDVDAQALSNAPAPKLSAARRELLLQKFKTVATPEFPANKAKEIPWFIPMSAAALLMGGILTALLLPTFSRSKAKSELGEIARAQEIEQLSSGLIAPTPLRQAAELPRKSEVRGDRVLNRDLGSVLQDENLGRRSGGSSRARKFKEFDLDITKKDAPAAAPSAGESVARYGRLPASSPITRSADEPKAVDEFFAKSGAISSSSTVPVDSLATVNDPQANRSTFDVNGTGASRGANLEVSGRLGQPGSYSPLKREDAAPAGPAVAFGGVEAKNPERFNWSAPQPGQLDDRFQLGGLGGGGGLPGRPAVAGAAGRVENQTRGFVDSANRNTRSPLPALKPAEPAIALRDELSEDLIEGMVPDSAAAALRPAITEEKQLAGKAASTRPEGLDKSVPAQQPLELGLRFESRNVMAGKDLKTREAEVRKLAELQDKEQSEESLRQVNSVPVRPAVPFLAEVQTSDNAFSTFSLNVTDVGFKLAKASLEQGQAPDPVSTRPEEFLNAFNYRDPDPAPGVAVAFAWDRAQNPFAHHRDLLRLAVKVGSKGRENGRPLNVVLLLDNSGSMERADRVKIIREALTVLAQQLHAQDRVSVVAFARTARLWVDNLAGDRAGELIERVGNLSPDGGTNLEEALNLAYKTASSHFLNGGLNRVVLLTDGAANLGDSDPASLTRKVEEWRKRGIALDCFGIGWEGLNDDLLEVLSRHGDGRYGFLNKPEETSSQFAAQLAGALQVAAADVKVQVEFNPQRVKNWRQIGYAKHQLTQDQFRDNTVDAAELSAAEAGNALYAIETDASGQGSVGTVRVRYREPESGKYLEHEWQIPYNGAAVAFDSAPASMRLAGSATAFAEWLAKSPYAGQVTLDQLLNYVRDVPTAFAPDSRPRELEGMLRQAKTVFGK
jgi:Mg-chelatase subunit ChlD